MGEAYTNNELKGLKYIMLELKKQLKYSLLVPKKVISFGLTALKTQCETLIQKSRKLLNCNLRATLLTLFIFPMHINWFDIK